MKQKVALVLSGGGAKGAFQIGAERYARETKGFRWDVISGVSIGALNGAMLAMRKHSRLKEIWDTITPQTVFGSTDAVGVLRQFVRGGRRSVFGLEGLQRFVTEEVETGAFDADFRVGAVSLLTGEFTVFRPGDEGFGRALMASAAMPMFFPPVDVTPRHRAMIDGGIRNVSPIGAVLDADPDHIVIINCGPQRSDAIPEEPGNIFRIGQRAFEICMNQVFTADVREFLRINSMTEQAAARGVTLVDERGRPFRSYRCTIIEPDERLGDTMDLSTEHVRRCLEAGRAKAKEVLG